MQSRIEETLKGTVSPAVLDISMLTAVLDNAVDGLVLLDSERNVIYMNEAADALLGQHGVGLHCGSLLHCHDEKRSTLQFDGCYGQCVLAAKRPMTDIEMNIIGPNGRVVPVEVTYSYIPLADSEPCLLMSLRDVTDKKLAERERRQKEELRYTLQERERLARDLHDGVVQDIAFVNMQVKLLLEDVLEGQDVTAEQLTRISEVLDNGYGELRIAIRDLSLGVSGNLAHHLNQSMLEFRSRTNIDGELHCDVLPTDLDASFVHQVTKIVQEALTNIGKHAQATKANVSVKLTQPTQALVVDVFDNGVGFVVSDKRKAGHYGMKTMFERCELLGGIMELESAPNQGTHVHFEIPTG